MSGLATNDKKKDYSTIQVSDLSEGRLKRFVEKLCPVRLDLNG